MGRTRDRSKPHTHTESDVCGFTNLSVATEEVLLRSTRIATGAGARAHCGEKKKRKKRVRTRATHAFRPGRVSRTSSRVRNA